MLEVAQFAVDGDEEARANDVEQRLLLLLAGVAGDVDGSDGVIEDVGSFLEEAVDDAVDAFLVAGDGVGGEDDGIARRDAQRGMASHRQAAQDGAWLALGAGGEDGNLVRRQAVDLLQRDDEVLRDIQVAELAGASSRWRPSRFR